MAKRKAEGQDDVAKLKVTRSLQVEGQMINAKTVQGIEVRLAVRHIEDENGPSLCELDGDDFAAAVHDFTSRRVRVTIEVLD